MDPPVGKAAPPMMAGTSGNRRALKTYSRRVNNTPPPQRPTKRTRAEEPRESIELPPAKKVARSSIQNYFKPLSSSSSPGPTRSAHQSSNDSVLRSTPPSSPPFSTLCSSSPPTVTSSPKYLPRPKRPKRRLTTKMDLPPLPSVQLSANDPDAVCFRCYDGTCNHRWENARRSRHERQSSEAFDKEDGYSPVVEGDDAPSLETMLASIPNHLECAPRAIKLIQTQITGGKKPARCASCGFPFDTTKAEDMATHKLFHNSIVYFDSQKYDFSSVTDSASTCDIGSSHQIKFCVFDSNSGVGFHKFVESVILKKVDSDLGYARESDDSSPSLGYDILTGHIKVFMALVGPPGPKSPLRPVGVAVVKKAESASIYTYTERNGEQWGVDHPCEIMVDRIWVDVEYRKLVNMSDEPTHLASRLVDFVRANSVHNHTVEKKKTAFSQPTTSGYRFGCRYFHDEWLGEGFLVVKP